MQTVGDELVQHADRIGYPLRTLSQVKAGMRQAAKNGAETTMARMMLRYGRMTNEARAWLADTFNDDGSRRAALKLAGASHD